MVTPMDLTANAFMFAESRDQPMHVGGLELFEPPEGAGQGFVSDFYREMLSHDDPGPLFLKRPYRSLTTGGAWVWAEDREFDLEYHVRHSALPRPGRIRELLELCGRLHSTRLALERPLWEVHVIEGLADGRMAIYTKMHHALVDGVGSMRLLRRVLSQDPGELDMAPLWSARHSERAPVGDEDAAPPVAGPDPLGEAAQEARRVLADAAGIPGALVRTLTRGLRNETSAVSLYAPRTIVNKKISGARRFAAEDWSLDRIRAVGAATATTVNDVVLAMCSGALRRYLLEVDALPEASLVAMVPVSLRSASGLAPSARGGNAVGAVMARLGTDLADPAVRLAVVHESMTEGKSGLGSMTPNQVLTMSAVGVAPAVLIPMLGLDAVTRPPFNLVISNVPGPRSTHFYNGARLVGVYPLSIPIHGMGLNITCTSYADRLGFGLTGCRRTVPRLQRLLGHLDSELAALEEVAGTSRR